MDEPAGVLFYMDAGELDTFLAPFIRLDLKIPAKSEWFVVLGDLVRLVKVRVKIILTGKLGFMNDCAVERLCDPKET